MGHGISLKLRLCQLNFLAAKVGRHEVTHVTVLRAFPASPKQKDTLTFYFFALPFLNTVHTAAQSAGSEDTPGSGPSFCHLLAIGLQLSPEPHPLSAPAYETRKRTVPLQRESGCWMSQ